MLENNATLGGTSHHDKRFQELKVELHEQLIAGLDFAVLRTVDPTVVRRELRRAADRLCSQHSDLLSRTDRARLIEELVDETLGLGPLEPLMNDPTITDILINGPDCVYVERRGRLESVNIRFRDSDHLLGIVQRIAGKVGRRLDEASPMVDARLPDGSRLNAVIPPLALDGPLISLRRFFAKPLTPNDLIARKTATPEMLTFLAACVKARLNIVISGGTGSGKTTLLNVLSGFIPTHERIATIEDTAELQLQQPHVARMETRPPNLDGKGEITSSDLLRNALRMRPDRIIVGECRSCEAFDMLQAMNTGHDGGLSTIHANDTRESLSRLEMLVGLSAPELPMPFIRRQIASAIHIVVQVARLSSGERKVMQISEITGLHGEAINMHDVFVYRQTGGDADTKVNGRFESCGIIPNCLPRIEAKGVELRRQIFEQKAHNVSRLDQLRGMQ